MCHIITLFRFHSHIWSFCFIWWDAKRDFSNKLKFVYVSQVPSLQLGFKENNLLFLTSLFFLAPQPGGGVAVGGSGWRGSRVSGHDGGVRRGRLHLRVSSADPVTSCFGCGFAQPIGCYSIMDVAVSNKWLQYIFILVYLNIKDVGPFCKPRTVIIGYFSIVSQAGISFCSETLPHVLFC